MNTDDRRTDVRPPADDTQRIGSHGGRLSDGHWLGERHRSTAQSRSACRRHVGHRHALVFAGHVAEFFGDSHEDSPILARYMLVLDVLFCLGIGTMVVASLLLTYMVI